MERFLDILDMSDENMKVKTDKKTCLNFSNTSWQDPNEQRGGSIMAEYAFYGDRA